MTEDSANPLTPMENGTNADQRNDHGHAAAEGSAQPGAPAAADGNTQPMGNPPADGNGQFNGYAPSNGGAQPMGYAPVNGYAAPQPNSGIPANAYTGSQPYTSAQPTQSMPYTQPMQPMQPMQPVQPTQPVQSGPFLSQQPTTQSRQTGDKPQMDTSKILQYVTLGISIIALILGIVANVHVAKPYRIASVAASKPTGGANSEKDSDAKSDSKAKSESDSTDDGSSKDFSGAGIKGKYVGIVNGEEMYELDLPGRRSNDSNNKGYTVSADSKLKGDYRIGDHKMHLEITNFEADSTSATLTTEVTNNGTSEGIASFGASLSQNDEAVDIGVIGSASTTIEPGHKETLTTKFRINDPSQPITITVHLTGEKMIATFTPRS